MGSSTPQENGFTVEVLCNWRRCSGGGVIVGVGDYGSVSLCPYGLFRRDVATCEHREVSSQHSAVD